MMERVLVLLLVLLLLLVALHGATWQRGVTARSHSVLEAAWTSWGTIQWRHSRPPDVPALRKEDSGCCVSSDGIMRQGMAHESSADVGTCRERRRVLP